MIRSQKWSGGLRLRLGCLRTASASSAGRNDCWTRIRGCRIRRGRGPEPADVQSVFTLAGLFATYATLTVRRRSGQSGPAMTTRNAAEEYRRAARECLAMAENPCDPEHKAQWLDLAQHWLRLAEHTEDRWSKGTAPPTCEPADGAP
jgi:hypothetical protein